MASLTSTVTTLTDSLATANEKLVTAFARIAVLEKELAAAKGTPATPKVFSKTHYCHTHGPQSGHPSDKCRKPGTEHNPLVTNTNRLGGGKRLGLRGKVGSESGLQVI